MFNKKTRTFLLLSLIFLAVLGLSTISANDIDNNQNSTTNTYKYTSHSSVNNIENELSNKNPVINKNTNNNIKTVDEGTFTDLNTKIADNNDITLENDYTKSSDETQITISKNISINGNGKTIESDNGMFTITSTGNVTFTNVNFMGGSGSNSAFTVNGILNLINCTFSDHTSNSRAFDVTSGATVTAKQSSFHDIESQGAFYLATRTTAEFKDCEFTNCLNTVYGGAITNYRSGTLTIDNCTFTDNKASQRGGAIYTNGGTLIVKNSTFTGNEVQTTSMGNHQGGKALYIEGEVYLYNNTMTNNRGISADIFNSYATIHTPVTITINNATCNEGEKVNLTASIMDDNGNTIDLISEPTDIIGLEDAVNLTHFNFTIQDNKYNVTRTEAVNGIVTRTVSPNLPAGLYEINAEYWTTEFEDATVLQGTLNITETPLYSYQKLQNIIGETSESTITLDYDVKRGVSESTVNFTKDMTLDLNGHTWDATTGQAIEILNNANVMLRNGVIVNVGNSQPSSMNSYGRLARITEGSLVFENITVTNSSAPDFSGLYKGSLIRLSTNTSFTLNNSTVTMTTGRFIIDNGRGTLNINNTQFKTNKLGSVDSLIEINGKTSITNTVFDDNTANWGIIYGNNQKELLTLNNTTFTNNIITVGAPIVTGNDTEVYNSKFSNNKATSMNAKSGAIYTNGGSLTVTNSTFTGNTANDNDGSIIHHTGYIPGDLSVSNSILIPADNRAAIYNEAEDEIQAVANYNYWGTNTTPANLVKKGTYYDEGDEECDCTPVELKYWRVMNTTVTPNENLKVGQKVLIQTSYDTYTDGTTYNTLEDSIPDMQIEYTASSGSIESPVTTQQSQAINEYKIESETTTITITDSYNTNTIVLTATTPQAQTITLNDGNWTYYFDEDDGFVKQSIVAPGSELRFEGEFQNRNMYIDIPVNITTADQQAVFYQSSFTILSDNVNITQIIMNGESLDYPLIGLEDASNINIISNNLTLTNNEDKTITHTIEIFGGNNNQITNNTITTTGPEDAIEYATDYEVLLVYTTSIYASSENITLDNNNITTKHNGINEELGTIYGIYLQGSEEDTLNNARVVNNNFITNGTIYEYTVKMDWTNNAIIENNTISTTSNNFASGIHLFAITNSQINNNNITSTANKTVYAIVTEGAINIETEEMITPKNNTISGNNLELTSKHAWAIEAYAGEENKIQYNNINITADNGIGIGLTDKNSEATYNNIIVTAAMQENLTGTYDYISPYTAGIKIVENGLSDVKSNKATHNNITVNAPNNEIPAINITTNDNTITDNYLVSPYAKGNEAVINNGTGNIIENNTPNQIKTTIKTENITIRVGDEELLSFEVLDKEENTVTTGQVTAYIDGIQKQIIILDTDIPAVPLNELTTGNHTLQLEYKDNSGTYADSKQTSNIEVIKKDYELDVTIDENLIYKDQVQIMGVLYESDDYASDKEVTIQVNGETLTTETTNEYGEFEYALTAEIIGTNNVTIKVRGNDKYNDLTSEYTFNVRKATLTISLEEIGEMAYGDDTWILGEVNDDNANPLDDIELNITVNNKTYTTKTIDNMFEYMFKSDVLGTNNITVRFAGNEYYESTQTNITYEVYKLNTLLILEDINDTKIGQNILITGELYDERDQPLANQTVHITINSITVDVTTNNDGVYGFIPVADTVDKNTVTVKYDGTMGLESAIKETTFNVEKQESKITLNNISDTKYNKTITIKGKLEDITGKAISEESIALLVNDEEITVITDEDGTFTYNYTTNIIGTNNVTAVFYDNGNYEESHANITYEVYKVNTRLTLEDINDTKIGQDILITGELYDEKDQPLANQTVHITINSITVDVTTNNDGVYGFISVADTVGKNTVTVKYDGMSELESAINETAFNVEKQTSVLTLNNINDTKYNKTITIKGKLEDITGKAISDETIALLVNDEEITVITDEEGIFTYNYITNTAGINNIIAVFDENEYYEDSNATIQFDVSKLATTISLDSIKNTKLNSTITVTGQVKDENGQAVMGQVNLLINNARATVLTDNDGKFTYNYTVTKVGENNITATYRETNNTLSSNTTLKVTVTQLNTKINLSSIKTVKLGESTIINGQLLDETGKGIYGSIKLTINNAKATIKTDNNGYFTYNYTTTRVGVNNITASYLESTKYTATNTTTTFNVQQKATKITLNKITPVKMGNTTTITGQLQDESGKGIYGTVKLLINGGRATVKTDTNGFFTYNYTTTRVGVNNITASYLESTKYTATNTTSTFNVLQKATKIKINNIKNTKYAETVTITGQLQDESGKGIYGTVKLLINGGRATVKTDTNGFFTYNYTTSHVGVNNITASYLESTKYTATNTTTHFTVEAQNTKLTINTIKTTTQKTNITITGKLSDKNGKGFYGTVKLLINNGRATVKTDTNGAYSYTYTATRIGTNNITASYLGSNKYMETNITTTFTVIAKTQ